MPSNKDMLDAKTIILKAIAKLLSNGVDFGRNYFYDEDEVNPTVNDSLQSGLIPQKVHKDHLSGIMTDNCLSRIAEILKHYKALRDIKDAKASKK